MTTFEITQVNTAGDCRRCFDVMRELRPHLSDASMFAAQVLRQIRDGYRLHAAWQSEEAVGLIGYRIHQNLMNGRFLFVDDLVVRSDQRRSGLGTHLLALARSSAREGHCRKLVLDTGLGMALAQRFYFRQGMLTRSIGFHEELEEKDTTV